MREWATHLTLFGLTAITTTLAGIYLASPELIVPEPTLSTPLDYVLYIPNYYLSFVRALIIAAVLEPAVFIQGLLFSIALLTILTAHEMGHYLACRRYGVSATLPFFIPAPPLFLAGTFGAFIKIQSPIPSRRSLFDIGLAGPLAGFVVTIPIAIAGVLTLKPLDLIPDHGIVFNDPLLFRLIAYLGASPLGPDTMPNPFYMAAWIGLLVTSLNLMPVGQLDGGHGTFSVFGLKAHNRIGWIAFVITALLAFLGLIWHSSSSGFLYTILLGVMLRVRHPEPRVAEPLGKARIAVGVLTLLVFILSFWPFPLTII